MVVCFGLGLFMVQQTQTNHSSQAFASWLTAMLKASDGVKVQQELDDLRKSTTHFDEFVKEASQIVKTHNERFPFIFTESAGSVHLYQLLLIEWSQFQTGNAMAGIPVETSAKTFVSIALDNKGAMGTAVAVFNAIPKVLDGFEKIILANKVFFVSALEPMTEGIAIGAP